MFRKALVLVVAIGVAVTGHMPAAAQDQGVAKTERVVDLINHTRVDAGLLPLARSTELEQAAQAHSLDMVQQNYLDHTGADGTQPQERADRAGYHVPPNSAWIVVEVISAISGEPQGPVDWWMGDDQHKKVLLNPRWREIGAGYAQGGEYGNYWTVDFGCRPGVLPTLVFEGTTYTHSEECGDPSLAATLAATAQPTGLATPTLIATPTVLEPATATAVRVNATLSVSQSGNALAVSWSGVVRPSATDWIGVYRPEAGDSAYQEWAYVSCSNTPDEARASGTCSLPLPGTGGSYEVRMFGAGGYTRLALSSVTLASPAPVVDTASLRVGPTLSSYGRTVQVQWSGMSNASSTDWIGLYRPEAADNAPLAWLYVGCAHEPLDARPLGACTFPIPSDIPSGAYELRLFRANTFAPRVATTTLNLGTAT